jgi:hypothetical protein
MRYCIIAGPRSGSTWVEFILLGHLRLKNINAVRLGEFFHPHVAKFEQFILSPDKFIISGKKEWLTDFETISGRISMILESDVSQSLTIRLFPQEYAFDFINYSDVAKQLKLRNFKFISLYRNIFSRAISWATMEHTSIVHKFNERGIQYHSTYVGDIPKKSVDPITICPANFTRILLMTIRDDISRRIISESVGAVEIDYDNLEKDLKKIGVSIRPTHMELTHDVPYDKLITNYDQLLDIYNKLKNTNL